MDNSAAEVSAVCFPNLAFLSCWLLSICRGSIQYAEHQTVDAVLGNLQAPAVHNFEKAVLSLPVRYLHCLSLFAT